MLGSTGFLGKHLNRILLDHEPNGKHVYLYRLNLRDSGWRLRMSSISFTSMARVVLVNCLSARHSTFDESKTVNYELPLAVLNELDNHTLLHTPYFINLESYWQYIEEFSSDVHYVTWKSALTSELNRLVEKEKLNLHTLVLGHLGGPMDNHNRLFPRAIRFYLFGIGESPFNSASLFPYSDVRDVSRYLQFAINSPRQQSTIETFPPHWISLSDLEEVVVNHTNASKKKKFDSSIDFRRRENYSNCLPNKAILTFPLKTFAESIKDTIEWIQKEKL